MFETDSIPSGWIQRLNYMDEVWVPTEFAREIFEKQGVESSKLHVVGEAVDTEYFAFSDHKNRSFESLPGDLKKLAGLSTNTFVFLFVGKFESRKGLDILLRAYMKEFSAADDVLLVFLTSAFHSSDDFDRKLQAILVSDEELQQRAPSSLPPFRILTGLPQSSLKLLCTLIDILVIPSRGEGWGRPHVEAMSSGRPVIATHWSGPTEYINERNGYPLRIEGLVDAEGWKGHKWAQPSEMHLREIMRHVYLNREEVLQKGKVASSDMTRRFSLNVMGNLVMKELLRVNLVLEMRRNGTSLPKDPVKLEL